jgi:hypothetical protein
MEILFFVFSIILGFTLSIYAGVIVARYMAFDDTINRARSIIFHLEQEWKFRYLDNTLTMANKPFDNHSVFMSKVLSNNHISWHLTEIGLKFKELGHWNCGRELDRIGMEIDNLREELIEKAKISPDGLSFNVLGHIADWHRRISSFQPVHWQIMKPWPHKKYKNMSCIQVDEITGEWHEVNVKRPETIFDKL